MLIITISFYLCKRPGHIHSAGIANAGFYDIAKSMPEANLLNNQYVPLPEKLQFCRHYNIVGLLSVNSGGVFPSPAWC